VGDPSAAPARPGANLGERREDWRGIEYVVRPISGSQSSRAYRCPGCDQEIAPRQPHVVAWAADDPEAEDRRHWHTVCWGARDRRAPTVQRGRGAPRY
jgi:hypothetical protein